jgi:hypothetical protein
MQPSSPNPDSPPVEVIYPQHDTRGGVEPVSSDALQDAEKIASKMLEAQVCVLIAVPAGIFLLGMGVYELVVEFYMNVNIASIELSIILIVVGLIALGAGRQFGREGLSLYVSPSGIFIRTLKYGFFNEKVFKVNRGTVVGIEEEHGITLYYSSTQGKMTRIEAGLNEKRYEEIMAKISSASQ